MIRPLLKKTGLRMCTTLFLLSAILLMTYGPVAPVKKVEAVDDVVVIGGTGTIQETITAAASVASEAFDAISSAAVNSLALKEGWLDALAWELVNMIIQQMSRSIIMWINSGFQGSPAFVSDLQGFMLDVADQAAGRFIEELGLGFMCSPFRLEVTLAIALQYQRAREYEIQCRLSDVVANVDNFLNGDFGSGGWGGWFQLTNNPVNNPYGAMVIAEHELGVRIRNAQGEEWKLLDFGRGFLSFKQCEEGIEGTTDLCKVVTPGAAIQNQLDTALDLPAGRLQVADEINEILGALFSQLAIQAFQGAGGLLGLSSGGYSSNGGSYLDAMAAESISGNGVTSTYQNPITNSITTERRYISLQEQIVSMVDAAEAYELDTYGTTTCSNRPLPASITGVRTTALGEIGETTILVNRLQALETQFTNASNAEVKSDVMEEYLAFQSSGEIHTEVDNTKIAYQVIGNDFTGLKAEIKSYQTLVDQDCMNNRNANNNFGP